MPLWSDSKGEQGDTLESWPLLGVSARLALDLTHPKYVRSSKNAKAMAVSIASWVLISCGDDASVSLASSAELSMNQMISWP